MNPRLNEAVDALRDEIIETLARWIRIPSERHPAEAGAPFGKPMREMLTVALRDAQALGMRVRDFDGYIGDAEMGDGAETMGILAHLDVVPAGDGWQMDPYGADIIEGRLYGRGAQDDKGPAVAALYAMKAVLDAGIPLKRKVRLILGCDEESGWEDIAHYQKCVEMPDFGFSPDAEYPIINTEKGIEQIRLTATLSGEAGAAMPIYRVEAGERPNVIPGIAEAEIGCADIEALRGQLAATGLDVVAEPMDNGHVRLISTGVTGHAAMPDLGRNAAVQLLLALKAVGAGGASRTFIERVADGVGMEASGKGFGVDGSDAISGPLTMNLGILRITQDSAMAVLDIRHPVLMNGDMIAKILSMAVADAGISVRVDEYKAPLHVPADSFIVKSLLEVYHDVTGLAPYTIAIGGGTYSRSMDNCVAFGCSFPGTEELAHQAGEYFELDALMKNVRIFAHAIEKLAGA